MKNKNPICIYDKKECTNFDSMLCHAECEMCTRYGNGVRATGEMPALRQFYHTFKSLEMWYKIWRMKEGMDAESKLKTFCHKMKHYKSRCYVSGKISGLDDFEWNFHESSKKVAELGFIPVNPCNLPPRKSWTAFMFWDLLEMCTCRNAYFMANHTDSRGAKIELIFAKLALKHIIYE